MSDVLKEIFGSFAEASRIGMRLQQQADEEMKWERMCQDAREREARRKEFDEVAAQLEADEKEENE